MPSDAAIGQVFAPYCPGRRHGHQFWLKIRLAVVPAIEAMPAVVSTIESGPAVLPVIEPIPVMEPAIKSILAVEPAIKAMPVVELAIKAIPHHKEDITMLAMVLAIESVLAVLLAIESIMAVLPAIEFVLAVEPGIEDEEGAFVPNDDEEGTQPSSNPYDNEAGKASLAPKTNHQIPAVHVLFRQMRGLKRKRQKFSRNLDRQSGSHQKDSVFDYAVYRMEQGMATGNVQKIHGNNRSNTKESPQESS